MAIDIRCPKCSRRMRLEAMPESGRVRCGECGVLLNVPASSQHETAAVPTGKPSPSEDKLMSAGPTALPAGQTEELIDFGSVELGSSALGNTDGLDESIDFVPFPAQDAPRPRRVALGLSDGQLRDALAAASTTRSSVNFLAWVLFISLIIQGLIIVASVIAMLKSQSRGGDVAALVSVGVSFVAVMMTGVSAFLLKEYGSRLADFLRSKQADDLVESLGVAGRYWLTTAAMMILTLGLGALALMAIYFFSR